MKRKMYNSFFVAMGGSIGSLLRYLVSFIHPYGPFSTIVVNLVGSFLLGFITVLFLQRKEQEKLKLFFGTGFCGGFTTMSTFSLELTLLSVEQAILYMSSSVIGGFILVMLGMKAAGTFTKMEYEKW